MNRWIESLYQHCPVLVQHAMITAYGIKLRRLRLGGEYQRFLEELLKSERYSVAELRAFQCEQLRALIRHCYENVPYYERCLKERKLTPADFRQPEDLSKLPILEKETVRSRPDLFQARNYRAADCEIVGTSGSTGATLRIPVNLAGRRKNYAFFGRLKHWAGINLSPRGATFAGRVLLPAGTQGPPFWRYNLATNTLLFSSYHLAPQNLPYYVEKLRQWAPDYIDSYPSSIELVSRFILERQMEGPRPKAIITSSETLSEAQRATITQALHAPVFDQYGSAEQVAFISNCEAGTYHIHPEFGVTELIPVPAQPGTARIVATGFTNWAMPLLRYNTGDLALLSTATSCRCGRHFPQIGGVLGRMDDLIVTPDGRRVGRLDPVFKGLQSIRRAQMVQDNPRELVIRLVPGAGFDAQKDIASIRHELENRLGTKLELKFEVVDDIPVGPGGKFRAVISRVKSPSPPSC